MTIKDKWRKIRWTWHKFGNVPSFHPRFFLSHTPAKMVINLIFLALSVLASPYGIRAWWSPRFYLVLQFKNITTTPVRLDHFPFLIYVDAIQVQFIQSIDMKSEEQLLQLHCTSYILYSLNSNSNDYRWRWLFLFALIYKRKRDGLGESISITVKIILLP